MTAPISSYWKFQPKNVLPLMVLQYVISSRTNTVYRRTGFDCKYLLNAKCELFYDSTKQSVNYICQTRIRQLCYLTQEVRSLAVHIAAARKCVGVISIPQAMNNLHVNELHPPP